MIELTDEYKALFRSLQGSETGRLLRSYLEKLTDSFCDVRNMTDITTETIKARMDISKLLYQELIERMSLVNEKKLNDPNKFT